MFLKKTLYLALNLFFLFSLFFCFVLDYPVFFTSIKFDSDITLISTAYAEDDSTLANSKDAAYKPGLDLTDFGETTLLCGHTYTKWITIQNAAPATEELKINMGPGIIIQNIETHSGSDNSYLVTFNVECNDQDDPRDIIVQFGDMILKVKGFIEVKETPSADMVIFVDKAAPNGGNGTSWEDAFNNFPAAINATSPGNEIWAKEGTYLGPSFWLEDGVKLYGGFDSSLTSRMGSVKGRGLENDISIIDGQNQSKNINLGNNSYIDGFTFKNFSISGGGILYTNFITAGIANCVFKNNTVNGSAALIFVNYGTLYLCDCVVADNSITGFGNGSLIYNNQSSIDINDCVFTANSVLTNSGGVIYNTNGIISYTNSIFENNSTIGHGGALHNISSSSTIINCVFENNSASMNGGAVYNNFGNLTIINSTFAGNSSTNSGGAIWENSSDLTITNSILWGNSAGFSGDSIYHTGFNLPKVTYSDIEGGWPGAGNINLNPFFVDMANGDLSLQSNSPCIDAANGDAAPQEDIADNPRVDDPAVPNTGTGTPEYADIGVYEYTGHKETKISFILDLPEGWSMISLPVIPDDASVSSLFPDAGVVYSYKPKVGYERMSGRECLKPGKGYWIFLNKPKSYTLTGDTIHSYTRSINLAGWYMIGGCSSQAKASVKNCTIRIIYEFIQGIGYQRVLKSEYLKPGKGYWILLEDIKDPAEFMVIPRPAPSPFPPPPITYTCNQEYAMWKYVDVTEITGAPIEGPVISWQTKNGEYLVEHLAGRSPIDDLIVFWWSPQSGTWKSANVTQVTGEKIAGPLTSWQTENGPFIVEHLAARNRNNELIVFWWSPQSGTWKSANVTQITGLKVAGPLTSWQTPNGPYNVEHLASMSPTGDLIVFWWSPLNDWQAVNVSHITGNKISGCPTSWQTPNGPYNVEHLAAMSPTGDLIVFWWSPLNDWQSVNVSSITGQKIAGSPTSWQTKNGNYNVEHLSAMGPNNELFNFWWSSQHDWQFINVSEFTNGKIDGPTSVYQLSENEENAEILAAKSPDNHLLLFWWKPSIDWQMVDISAATGKNILSPPEAWVTPDGAGGWIEHFAAEAESNHLIVFWGNQRGRALTEGLLEPYHSLKRQVGTKKVLALLWDFNRPGHPALPREQFKEALFGATGSVRDYFLENSKGRFTIESALGNNEVGGWYEADHPFEHYINHIIFVFVRGVAATSTFTLDVNYTAQGPKSKTISGTVNAGEWIEHSFKVESQSVLTVTMTGTGNADLYLRTGHKPDLNNYDCRSDGSTSQETCSAFGPSETCEFVNPYMEGWAEAIKKADAEIDFSQFDFNGDKKLSPSDEVAILIIKPQNNTIGFVRPIWGREVPSNEPMVVDGVTIPSIAEWYGGNPPGMGTAAHELAHVLLGAGDEYSYFPYPYDPGTFSLMSIGNYNTPPTHMSPIEKLKHGWLHSRIIFRSGVYELEDVETSSDVWILLDPFRGTDEFFIVENRWGGTSYDSSLRDEGLAVWHFTANYNDYCDISFKPDDVGNYDTNENNTEDWLDIMCGGDWPRGSIRMIRSGRRALGNGYGITPSLTMWDGDDITGATSYDLVSNDPDPTHAEIRWADGTPSGFAIRDISGTGQVMRARVEVPWCYNN